MSHGERLYDVLRLVRPVHQLSAQLVTDRLTGSDLTVPMRAVLERLHDNGAMPVPQIARELFITRQGVQAVVDEARALGLVELQDNPAHRRSRLVVLTEQGRAAYVDLHRAELEELAGIATHLAPDDVEATIRVLTRLVPAIRTRIEEEGTP